MEFLKKNKKTCKYIEKNNTYNEVRTNSNEEVEFDENILEKNLKNLSKAKEIFFYDENSKAESITNNSKLNNSLEENDGEVLKLEKRKSLSSSSTVGKTDDVLSSSCFFSERKSSANEPIFLQQNYFGQIIESTPLSNYFLGAEEYLKGLYPEGNNYNKTGNYIKKEIFFKSHESVFSETNKKISNLETFSLATPDLSTLNALNGPSIYGSDTINTSTNSFLMNLNAKGKGKFDIPFQDKNFLGFVNRGYPRPPSPNEYNSINLQLKTDIDNNEKDNIFNKEKSQLIPMILPIQRDVNYPNFANNMQIPQKYHFNKMDQKPKKPFMEREGDWSCKYCKNLNFAFRYKCNRCKCPKDFNSNENDANKYNRINPSYYLYNKFQTLKPRDFDNNGTNNLKKWKNKF